MSSPTPENRGRGRGKGRKERTSNERVTDWVNQREAKRLTRQKWANRNAEQSGFHEDLEIDEFAVKMENEEMGTTESNSERLKPRKEDVQVYIPPSLRTKQLTSSRGHHDPPELDCSTSCSSVSRANVQGSSLDSEMKEDTGYVAQHSTEQLVSKGTERQRGKGRGSKKREMEIYVPRALRAARTGFPSNAKLQGPETSSARKYLVDNIEKKKEKIMDSTPVDSVDNRVCRMVNSSVDSTESRVESLEHTEPTPFSIIHDPRATDFSCERFNEKIMSDRLSEGEIHRQKGGVETEDSVNLLQTGVESPVDRERNRDSDNETSHSIHYQITETKDSPSPLEETKDCLTFEFYDPAVIAFMPSPNRIHEESDFNVNNSQFPGYESSSNPVNICNDVAVSCHENSNHGQSFLDNIEIQTGDLSKDGTNGRDRGHDFYEPFTIQIEEELNIEGSGSQNKCISSEQMSDLIVAMPSTAASSMPVNEHKSLCALNHEDIDNYSYHDHSKSLDVKEFSSVDVSKCEVTVEKSSEFSNNVHLTKPLISSTPKSDRNDNQQLRTEGLTLLEREVNTSSESNTDDKAPGEIVGIDTEEVDEESWDALFDDNGDCLDDSSVQELTAHVGKVEIDRPKINYLKYQPKEPEFNYEAFSHIIEIYDFPEQLATCDLIAAFRNFASRGFDVKWVDDTHALGVFSSTIAANEALKMMHPLMKVRPLSEASKKGQSKARNCQEFLQPYKARPETTSIAARRLVAGALGMAPKVSKELRDQERKKLKEAKDKRRQERQQKVDIWDGSFGKCAMDKEDSDVR